MLQLTKRSNMDRKQTNHKLLKTVEFSEAASHIETEGGDRDGDGDRDGGGKRQRKMA